MTVHPTRRYFAVGGRGYRPRIFIYTYPEKEVVRILSDGAERGYASLNFNLEGCKLASVSTSPDFLLTVWNWQEEAISLHCKAFGQDVTMVKFSIDDDRRLTTSGTGHIRFWKMASTFTGLKLQGYIGKFGKVDLSDIAAFIELPDGKVISGSENGALLLWEGNFIKCRFVRADPNSPRSQQESPRYSLRTLSVLCLSFSLHSFYLFRSRYHISRGPRVERILPHAGEVTYVAHDREENSIISAGNNE